MLVTKHQEQCQEYYEIYSKLCKNIGALHIKYQSILEEYVIVFTMILSISAPTMLPPGPDNNISYCARLRMTLLKFMQEKTIPTQSGETSNLYIQDLLKNLLGYVRHNYHEAKSFLLIDIPSSQYTVISEYAKEIVGEVTKYTSADRLEHLTMLLNMIYRPQILYIKIYEHFIFNTICNNELPKTDLFLFLENRIDNLCIDENSYLDDDRLAELSSLFMFITNMVYNVAIEYCLSDYDIFLQYLREQETLDASFQERFISAYHASIISPLYDTTII